MYKLLGGAGSPGSGGGAVTSAEREYFLGSSSLNIGTRYAAHSDLPTIAHPRALLRNLYATPESRGSYATAGACGTKGACSTAGACGAKIEAVFSPLPLA